MRIKILERNQLHFLFHELYANYMILERMYSGPALGIKFDRTRALVARHPLKICSAIRVVLSVTLSDEIRQVKIRSNTCER